jgi:murein DD-endopeptidase MepM/ murein hydrolase activator NlpD
MRKPFKKMTAKQFAIMAGVLLTLSLLVYMCGVSNKFIGTEDEEEEEIGMIDSTECQQEHMKYGLSIDDFHVHTTTVESNQNLSSILNKYGVSSSRVYEICEKAKDVFNVRKMRAGQSYSVLSSKDSLNTPEYFIYEDSSLEYVVFDLHDDMKVYKGEKEVEKVNRSIKGTIESSLWNAMVVAKGNPLLTMKLSEIYQWTIDFFGITKGDSFKILYEEWLVEGKPINHFEVKAVVLTHDGKDHYAYRYEQDGKDGFYDENGNSLQKAFLKAPLKFSRISSKFSNRRFHPVFKIYRAHHGVDYAAPTGTPVYSIADGKVIKKRYQKGGAGRYVKIKHNSTYSTCYMHFSRYAKGIKVGSRVKQGQIVGYVGMSGAATGPHLDFRVYKNGKPVNPLKIDSPSKTPINKVNKAAYAVLINTLHEGLVKS